LILRLRSVSFLRLHCRRLPDLQRVLEVCIIRCSVLPGMSLRTSQERNEHCNHVTGHFPFSVAWYIFDGALPAISLSNSARDSESPIVFSRTEEAFDKRFLASTLVGNRTGISTPSIWNLFGILGFGFLASAGNSVLGLRCNHHIVQGVQLMLVSIEPATDTSMQLAICLRQSNDSMSPRKVCNITASSRTR
jgi:hypothetical protein